MTEMMAGMGGWMWLMFAAWAAFLVAIVVFVVWVIRRASRLPAGSTGRRILEERYARGEIDADEFRRRLEVLEK